MAKYVIPKKYLKSLIILCKAQIDKSYTGDPKEEPDTWHLPRMDLTVGYSPEDGGWSYQTGDNSYTGGAYGHPIWGVVTVFLNSSSSALSDELLSQIEDQIADWESARREESARLEADFDNWVKSEAQS